MSDQLILEKMALVGERGAMKKTRFKEEQMVMMMRSVFQVEIGFPGQLVFVALGQ